MHWTWTSALIVSAGEKAAGDSRGANIPPTVKYPAASLFPFFVMRTQWNKDIDMNSAVVRANISHSWIIHLLYRFVTIHIAIFRVPLDLVRLYYTNASKCFLFFLIAF